MAVKTGGEGQCIGAVCSVLCWQSVECCSEFSQPDDDAGIRYVDDADVGADDWQRDVAEPGADDESDVDVERQRQRLPGDVSHVDAARRARGRRRAAGAGRRDGRQRGRSQGRRRIRRRHGLCSLLCTVVDHRVSELEYIEHCCFVTSAKVARLPHHNRFMALFPGPFR